MSSIIRRVRAVSLVMLAGLATVPFMSHAADSSCKQASLDAWFEQQRQLTDGNVSPFMKTPATECKKDAVSATKNDATPVAKNDVDASKAKPTSQE